MPNPNKKPGIIENNTLGEMSFLFAKNATAKSNVAIIIKNNQSIVTTQRNFLPMLYSRFFFAAPCPR
jgi:hypothetical protein